MSGRPAWTRARVAKFSSCPPGYKDKAPDGYIALPSATYQGYALLRSILRGGSDADVAKAVAYGRRVKLYPLSQAANPPPTIFVDAIDVVSTQRSREPLAKSDPGNALLQRDLSASYEKVGDVQVEQGDLAALKSYQDSLAIAERLAKSEPGNANLVARSPEVPADPGLHSRDGVLDDNRSCRLNPE
jgi:hypothetical protein